MKIEEAIKILANDISGEQLSFVDELIEAMQLGIEALKHTYIMRQDYPELWQPPLRGETKE